MKINKNNTLKIDTLEITSPTFIEGEYEFFTHDSSRVTKGYGETGKYRYPTNPEKTGVDTSTLTGYTKALNTVFECTGLENAVKTRIDFCYDDKEQDYIDAYKLNKLLLLMVAEKHKIKNRYQSLDLESGMPLTMRIQNKYIEAECYNKAEQEPSSNVKCRLELRSKALYDDSDEPNKEERELKKWLDKLQRITADGTIFNIVTDNINKELLNRYNEFEKRRYRYTKTQFVAKYDDFIFTMRQLTSLYKMLGCNYSAVQTSRYKKHHKLVCFSLKEVQNYVSDIRRAAEQFLEN